MFGTSYESNLTRSNNNGEFEIEQPISPAIFKAILDFYITGIATCPSDEHISDLREACDYFLIPFNMSTIQSNDLGKSSFYLFLISLIALFISFYFSTSNKHIHTHSYK